MENPSSLSPSFMWVPMDKLYYTGYVFGMIPGNQLRMSNSKKVRTGLRNNIILLTVLLLSYITLCAQQPDWNKYTRINDRLGAMLKYGVDLTKKQQPDPAIGVFYTASKISEQSGLDSFTCASNYLLAYAYRYKGRYDSSFYFLSNAKKIAEKNNYVTLQALVQIESFGIYNRLGKTDSAAATISRMQDILPALDSNSSESARIEMYLGHNDKHRARYKEALGHYYQALRIFNQLNDSLNEGNIYISLANVLVILGEPDKALGYHKQAADIFTQMGRHYELVNELVNISDLYITAGNLDSAESAIRKALPIAEGLKEKTNLVYAYVDLGVIYKLRKNFAASENYFLHSIQISEAEDNINGLIEGYQGLGEMYMISQRPALAEPYLEKHLLLAKQSSDKEEIMEASLDLARNQNVLGNYKKAYEYQDLYNRYKDSTYTESTARNMAEMESKYQTEKKEKEILLLKKDQQLNRLNIQKQRNVQLGSLIFLILLLLIGLLSVNRYRLLQRTKRMIEMEKMRNTISRNLHDDIGSTLTSINILSQVALKEEANGDSPLGTAMQKIKDRSATIMESMSDIVWTINPQNDAFDQMISKMKEFATEILEPLHIHYSFHEEGDFSGLKLDINKRKDFYLLFKEAINNAAKYSQCSNLIILLRQDDRQIHLTITDDGKGFNLENVTKGNGLVNMRERAASMKAVFRIETETGKGTRILLDVPIT
jgi:two-component system, NarL family, sensor histidine kinase UhpB